ncbi:MAG: DUF2920 family protein [Actinomycetota bacterium]
MIAEIEAPVDVELGRPRGRLRFAWHGPSAGIGPKTGLIFHIHGYGARFDDPYAGKLRPWLADQFDCVAVSVDYHGAGIKGDAAVLVAPDFFDQLDRSHGIRIPIPPGVPADVLTATLCEQILPFLASHGLTRLADDCVLRKTGDDYVSFGVLPALDHLAVAAHLIGTHGLDRTRLFAIGDSYGGYVASLISKIAPNTLRMVVDNSGFTGPGDNPAVLFGESRTVVAGVSVRTLAPYAFSQDTAAPDCFCASHLAIRDLDRPEHWESASDTATFAYHSIEDTLAPVARKQALAAMLAPVRRYDLRIVGEADVDGRLFKDVGHGMRASLRGLFSLSYDRWMATSPPRVDATDFDLGTTLALACADKVYTFRYRCDGVSLEIAAGS